MAAAFQGRSRRAGGHERPDFCPQRRTQRIDQEPRQAVRSHLGPLTQIEARYRAQFTSLDVLLSGMSTTSDYLTQQLANLPTYNN
jgi:hypothetical protein